MVDSMLAVACKSVCMRYLSSACATTTSSFSSKSNNVFQSSLHFGGLREQEEGAYEVGEGG